MAYIIAYQRYKGFTVKWFLIVALSLTSCKHSDSSLKGGGLSRNFRVFPKVGICSAIDLIKQGYTYNKYKQDKRDSDARVKSSSWIWTNLSFDKTHGQKLQTRLTHAYKQRGYYQPVFMSGIAVPSSYETDRAIALLSRQSEKAANKLAAKLIKSSKNQLSIRDTFVAALQETDFDPFKAAGLLSAATVFDRWRSQYYANVLDINRNDYAVLPPLLAPIGAGDKVGQIYHFWGFVGMILAKPYLMQGVLEANTVTYYYEVFRNKSLHNEIDTEDFDIDRSAISYAYHLIKTLSDWRSYNPTTYTALYRKNNCSNRTYQPIKQITKEILKCQIWRGYGHEDGEAYRQIRSLRSSEPVEELAATSLDGCQISAYNSLNKEALKNTEYEAVNFTYWRYTFPNGKEREGVIELGKPFHFVGHSKYSKTCDLLNTKGPTCDNLRMICTEMFCDLSPKTMKSCVRKRRFSIERCKVRAKVCLKKGEICEEIQNKNLWDFDIK